MSTNRAAESLCPPPRVIFAALLEARGREDILMPKVEASGGVELPCTGRRMMMIMIMMMMMMI